MNVVRSDAKGALWKVYSVILKINLKLKKVEVEDQFTCNTPLEFQSIQN